MPGVVDITLPDGRPGTVPEEQLGLALAAGATRATPTAAPEPGALPPDDPRAGTAGAVVSGLLGAARSATGGLSDTIYAEAGNLIGGTQTRADVLEALRTAKDAHPWANTAGELGGLLAPGGYGGGLAGVGEGVESAITSRLGEGLLGQGAGLVGRGAAEGAILGGQNAINEANLGDTDLNGEKFFASVGENALFGGVASLALGGGLRALGLHGRPGPMSSKVADTITGVEGGGKAILEDAKAAEAAVDAVRAAGATSEQAASIVDGAHTIAKTAADAVGTEAEGVVGSIKNMYRDVVGARDAGVRDAVDGAFAERANRLVDHDAKVADRALDLKKAGDTVFRQLGDTVDEVQFQQKPQQMAKLVDPAKLDVQADTVAKLLQDTDQTLSFWESTASKGGAEGAIKSLRKLHTDAVRSLAGIGEAADGALSRDLFVKMDNLKRSVDSFLQYGKKFGLPEAVTHPEFGLEPLANKLRSSLEDSDVWGQAGSAQKEWNATFSENFARHQDFVSRYGQSIDRAQGRPVIDLNAEKIAGQLRKFEDPAARFETVKTTNAFIDGARARVAAIEKYGDLTAQQSAKLNAGKAALDRFQQNFLDAVKDADTAAALRRQQLKEKGHAIGGLLGLVTDAITRPATTAARLGEVAHAINGVSKAIKSGVSRLVEGGAASKVVTKAPRAANDVAAEVGTMREIASNPDRLDAAVSKMTGDLGKHAPQTTAAVAATARRAVTYLAQNAPIAAVPMGIIGAQRQKPRYSDQQLHEYETKRNAVMDPKSVLVDLQHGRLNREGIQAVQAVYPKLYAEMQSMTRDYLEELDSKGKLDDMPYQQKARIATLLNVPADGTWHGDFITMMQASKAQPEPAKHGPGGGAPSGSSKRAIKLDSSVFATEAARIEGGGLAA